MNPCIAFLAANLRFDGEYSLSLANRQRLFHIDFDPQSFRQRNKTMQTILGPFHHDLENAFVDAICQLKPPTCSAPLLILMPSDLMRRRLKILLSRERGLSLLNVQLLTFTNYRCGSMSNPCSVPPELHIRSLFRRSAAANYPRGQPGAEPFAGIEDRAGGCAALWQTLRDLRDGLVDPTLALEALSEGHFSQPRQRTHSAAVGAVANLSPFLPTNRDSTDLSDLDRRATEQATASRFLATVHRDFLLRLLRSDADSTGFFSAPWQATIRPTLFFPLLPAKPAMTPGVRRTLLRALRPGPQTSDSVGEAENRTAPYPPAPACLTTTRTEAMRKPTKTGSAQSSIPSASRTKSQRRQKKSCG